MINKILITGGAGFLGSSLLDKILKLPNYYVTVMDNLSTGKITNLPVSKSDKWNFIKLNVNNLKNLKKIITKDSFDYIFHYAAVVGVKRTTDHPLKVLEDIEGFKNILQLSKNTSIKKIFYSSSSEVYGDPVEFPQNENTTPLNARLPYAVVKNIGEVFMKSYQKEYGLNFSIFRFFNTYGPKQNEDFVVSKFIKQALLGEDITIYGDGTQTRSFCFIDDNVETIIKILENNLITNQVINIGSDVETKVKDLAQKIIDITKSKSKIKYLPPLKEGDMPRRVADNSKMKSILGRPLTLFEEGLKRTIKHYNE